MLSLATACGIDVSSSSTYVAPTYVEIVTTSHWLAVGETIDLSSYTVGGNPPFTYSVAATSTGGGTIASTSKFTGDAGGMVDITVLDSFGTTKNLAITVAETNILNGTFSGGSASIVEISSVEGSIPYDFDLHPEFFPQARL